MLRFFFFLAFVLFVYISDAKDTGQNFKQLSSLNNKSKNDNYNILNFLGKFNEDNYAKPKKYQLDYAPSVREKKKSYESYKRSNYDSKPYKKKHREYFNDKTSRYERKYERDYKPKYETKMYEKNNNNYDRGYKWHSKEKSYDDIKRYDDDFYLDQKPPKVNFADKIYQPKSLGKYDSSEYESNAYDVKDHQYSAQYEPYSPYSSYDKSPFYKPYDPYPSTSYPSGQHPSYDPYSYIPHSFDPYPSILYSHDIYPPHSYHSNDLHYPTSSYGAHMPGPYEHFSMGANMYDTHVGPYDHYRTDSYGPHSSYRTYGTFDQYDAYPKGNNFYDSHGSYDQYSSEPYGYHSNQYKSYHQPRPVTYYPDPYPKPLAPVPYIPGITDLTKEFKSTYPRNYKINDYGYDAFPVYLKAKAKKKCSRRF